MFQLSAVSYRLRSFAAAVLPRFLRESFGKWYHQGRDDKHRPFSEQEDCATHTIGSTTLEATVGHMASVPAGVPHRFINSDSGRLLRMDIHQSPRFITEWIEDYPSQKLPYSAEGRRRKRHDYL